jgi:hypothetical protein
LAQLKLSVLDAAAAVVQMAPEQATAMLQAQRLHGCCTKGPSWLVQTQVHITGCAAEQVHILSLRHAAVAACAADLARLAVYKRSQPKLNFPQHVYSSEQVAAFGVLLTARYPGVRLADAETHNSSSSSSRTSTGSSSADSIDVESNRSARDRSS